MGNRAPMDFAEIRDCRNLTIQSIVDHYALIQPEKVFAVFLNPMIDPAVGSTGVVEATLLRKLS